MRADAAIGLLGGSFDPVHRAHLELAHAARRTLGLDAVWLVPARTPWQRASLGASPEHRRAMVALAISGEKGLELCDVELTRAGNSYTIDTLNTLRARHPDARFTLLLGADQLLNFTTWKDWTHILDLADLAVAPRPGEPWRVAADLAAALGARARTVSTIEMPLRDISATRIRARCAQGLTVDDLVPARVARYIEQHHLYSNH